MFDEEYCFPTIVRKMCTGVIHLYGLLAALRLLGKGAHYVPPLHPPRLVTRISPTISFSVFPRHPIVSLIDLSEDIEICLSTSTEPCLK